MVHAFALTDAANVAAAAQFYLLLLCHDTVVSFRAKQSLVRAPWSLLLRRKVYIPSPPHCETPLLEPKDSLSSSDGQQSSLSSQVSLEMFAHELVLTGRPSSSSM